MMEKLRMRVAVILQDENDCLIRERLYPLWMRGFFMISFFTHSLGKAELPVLHMVCDHHGMHAQIELAMVSGNHCICCFQWYLQPDQVPFLLHTPIDTIRS